MHFSKTLKEPLNPKGIFVIPFLHGLPVIFLYKLPNKCFCSNPLKVSQLILLNEAAQKDGVPLPDLVPSAQQIRQAVESLVLAGKKLVSETSDSVCYVNI